MALSVPKREHTPPPMPGQKSMRVKLCSPSRRPEARKVKVKGATGSASLLQRLRAGKRHGKEKRTLCHALGVYDSSYKQQRRRAL